MMPVVIRVPANATPEFKRRLFEAYWVHFFGSLDNPASCTIAIVEERQ